MAENNSDRGERGLAQGSTLRGTIVFTVACPRVRIKLDYR